MNQIINNSNTVDTTRIVKFASSQEELQTVKNNISQLLSYMKSHGGLYVDGMEYFCSISDMDNLFDIPLKELLTKISNDMRNGVEYDKSSSQFLFVTGLTEMVLDNISKQQTISLEDVKEFFLEKKEELDTRSNKDTLENITNLIKELESEIKALKKDSRILTKIKKDIEKSRQSQNSEIASSVQKNVTFFNNMNKEQHNMLPGEVNEPTPCLKPEQLTRDNNSVERNNSGNTNSTEANTSSNVSRRRFGKIQGEMMKKFGITIDEKKPSFIQGKINSFNDMGKEKSQEEKTHSLRSSNSSVGLSRVKELTNLFEKNTFDTTNSSSINENPSKNPRTSTPLSKGRQRHDSYESVDSGISSCSSETTTTFSNNKGTSVNLGSTQNRLMKEFGIPSVKQPRVRVISLVNKFNQFSEGLLSKDRQRHDSYESVDSGISLSGKKTNVSNLINKFEEKESSTHRQFSNAGLSSNETSSKNPGTSTPLFKGRQRHDSHESVDSGISSCSSETTNVSDLIKKFEGKESSTHRQFSSAELSNVNVSELINKFKARK